MSPSGLMFRLTMGLAAISILLLASETGMDLLIHDRQSGQRMEELMRLNEEFYESRMKNEEKQAQKLLEWEKERQRQEMLATMDRLAGVLGSAVWELDREQVTAIVRSFMENSDLDGIWVGDESGNLIAGFGQGGASTQRPAQKMPTGDDQFLERAVTYNGVFVGQVHLVPSSKRLDEILLKSKENQEELKRYHSEAIKELQAKIQDDARHATHELYLAHMVEVAIFFIVLMTAVYFIIRHSVIKPIEKLNQSAARVAGGDLDFPMESGHPDELGNLADSFLQMRDSIREKISALSEEILVRKKIEQELERHREYLSDLVADRTEELENSYKQLQQSTRQLARSNQDLDDFAYIIAHDLKEPLRSISRFAGMLEKDYGPALGEDGVHMLDSLIQASGRMRDLIEKLLYYSRLGRCELSMQPGRIEDVVAEAVLSIEDYLQENQAEVVVEGPMPEIVCDQVRLVQLFVNLFTNAVKYSEQGKKIIRVGIAPEKRALPSSVTRKPGPMVFFVADNGIGIPKKHFEHIFAMFRRLHTRDKYGGGTGSGLAIVKKMVERHGGKIWVESEEGKGTTFYFTLEKHKDSHN